ncbi:MAG: hypothetical protein Q8N35_02505 [Methylococcaceae bacterium]|nr:hypothetical protein [Methylococcaceae bacterium]MDZ4156852.1 hypothetical protein [Methylococcales bacterium]MDP2391762.1 hypothetical protein [Methylococcaceae bacterium]MDP3018436.1 hypothetical protein [Methylococcaceae bacterium]MDP3392106.1 hypothetical protein [Methylococcaceae bacterium]
MRQQSETKSPASDLTMHWLVVGFMAALLLGYIVFCHTPQGAALQQPLAEHERILLRTILYVAAIVTMPITNLIRHIQLRLNQTMPGNKSAKSRYLLTVIVSMTLIESIGAYGLIMYLLGDGYNTLHIFIIVSALGMYLYRPKVSEYESIVEALAEQSETV